MPKDNPTNILDLHMLILDKVATELVGGVYTISRYAHLLER